MVEDGDPIVELVTDNSQGGISFVLEGSGGGYHSYELIYDPLAASADLFVDGIEQISDYTGYIVPERNPKNPINTEHCS